MQPVSRGMNHNTPYHTRRILPAPTTELAARSAERATVTLVSWYTKSRPWKSRWQNKTKQIRKHGMLELISEPSSICACILQQLGYKYNLPWHQRFLSTCQHTILSN
jgi:hypothetical protein